MVKCQPTMSAIHELGRDLSIEDCNELVACGALPVNYTVEDIRELLTTCCNNEEAECYVILGHEGIPLMIGGTVPDHDFPDGTGIVWLLTSKYVDLLPKAERKEILAILTKHLDVCLKKYQRLYNVAWKKNTGHFRLLSHLGASFNEVEGHSDFLYFEFTKGGEKCVTP